MRPNIKLIPFQEEIIQEVLEGTKPEILVTGPRGLGKSFLAAQIATELIWDKSPHYKKGKSVIVIAGNLNQASILLNEMGWMRDNPDYIFTDSLNQKQIRHKKHGTALKVVSSKATGALGLGSGESLIIADECSSWSAREGALMHEAIRFALGKPGSDMRVLWISTIAPDICTFFSQMVEEGDTRRRKCFIWALKDEDKWDDPEEALRVNPLKAHFDDSRETLLEDLEEAKKDYGKSIKYKCWVMNFNTASEQQVLLPAPQVKEMFDREAPPREGDYILGIDLGDSTAFSAGAAIWKNGRVEVVAACSGIPSIRERERNDARQDGLYQGLVDQGLLHIAHDKHTTPLDYFVKLIEDLWGEPFIAVADQYRRKELQDSTNWYMQFLKSTTAEKANFGISAFREYASNGTITIAKHCQPLLALALADARVEADASGLFKCVKKNLDNTGRDDPAHALILACDVYKVEWDIKGDMPNVFSLA